MEIPPQARTLSDAAKTCRVFDRFPKVELSIATPGHPVNGIDPFTQPADGPFMLRLFVSDRSAYLWQNETGQWFIRPWMKQATHDDGLITQVTSLEDGMKRLE